MVDLRLLALELGLAVDDRYSGSDIGGSSVRFGMVELAPAFLLVFLLGMMSKGFEVGLDEYLWSLCWRENSGWVVVELAGCCELTIIGN
jgi:hypothetical protein